jgi:hypothetical protein
MRRLYKDKDPEVKNGRLIVTFLMKMSHSECFKDAQGNVVYGHPVGFF